MTSNVSTRIARFAPQLALAGLLAACGGGGGSGGFDDGADVSGIWFGSVDVDGGAQDVGAVLIVRSNGTIYLDTQLALLIGDAETQDNAFSAEADGYSYQDDFADGSDFSLSGTVTAGTVLAGAVSGAGISGTYTFTYDAELSTLAAALPDIAGTYESELSLGDSSTAIDVTIEADGDLTASGGGGCMLDGSVKVLASADNLYEWQADVTGCAVNGSAKGIGFRQDGGGFYFVGKLAGGAIYFSSSGDVLTAPRLRSYL